MMVQCPVCRQVMKDGPRAWSHLELVHGAVELPFLCPVCAVDLGPDYSDALRHVESHGTGQRPRKLIALK